MQDHTFEELLVDVRENEDAVVVGGLRIIGFQKLN